MIAGVLIGLSMTAVEPPLDLPAPPGNDPPTAAAPAQPEVPVAAEAPESGGSLGDAGGPEAAPPQPQKPKAQTPPPKASTPPPVSDEAWSAVTGKDVTVQTRSGPVQGELASSDGDALVIIGEDGSVHSVPKADATAVKVAKPPPSAANEMAALEAEPAPPEEDTAEDEPSSKAEERKKKREERREKREHAILGAFTMHGATYTHVRGQGVKGGHASYAMDFGIGANLSPGFGMYIVSGGLLGAKIRSDPGNGMRERLKHNYGKVAFQFAFGGKYYFSMVGAGVGFNRIRKPNGDLLTSPGLALPLKLMGKIPLPKKLYIGIGITYEFAAVNSFGRFINGIGGQIVVGRW